MGIGIGKYRSFRKPFAAGALGRPPVTPKAPTIKAVHVSEAPAESAPFPFEKKNYVAAHKNPVINYLLNIAWSIFPPMPII
ncbi:MAG: hypothetical protein K1X64_04710 [Myxococcaceae bacterium]|nr:hypothetical protein [Myxococcaceae bacterium]